MSRTTQKGVFVLLKVIKRHKEKRPGGRTELAKLKTNLEWRELKREMIKICHQMKEDIGLILFNTVNYCLNKVTAKTLMKVKHRHEKTLFNLRHTKESFMAKVILCLFVALYIIIHRTICQ